MLDAARSDLAGRTHRNEIAPAFLIIAAAVVAFLTILYCAFANPAAPIR
jgi:hypothetical protein